MHTYSKEMPVCATCQRWGGSRDPGRIIPFCTVWVVNTEQKGNCHGGSFHNLQMPPAASCSRYEKWGVLK